MKDLKDKKTTDAFKRGRGRPVTSTPEKKAADTAARMRAYRKRESIKKAVLERYMQSPTTDLKVLLQAITTDQSGQFQLYDQFDVPWPYAGNYLSPWDAAERLHASSDWSVKLA